jgi:hypothetical protein
MGPRSHNFFFFVLLAIFPKEERDIPRVKVPKVGGWGEEGPAKKNCLWPVRNADAEGLQTTVTDSVDNGVAPLAIPRRCRTVLKNQQAENIP